MLSLSEGNNLSLTLNSNSDLNASRKIGKFLQFNVGKGDSALLEAEIVTEVITVNRTEILSVPQMEYCVLGVYSWRSEMLWIVDLENLLGYPPNIEKEQASILHATSYTVLVLQLNGQSLGLVVPSVKDIVEQDWDTLQPPSLELFAKDIQPFLQGYFTENNQHILMLLKATEIIKNF